MGEGIRTWKNSSALVLLFIANSVSGVAQGISMIAIPWYFTKSGDTSQFGYMYAAITLVSLFWGPYSGTLVDRYDRRKIFMILNIVMGIILLCVSAYGYNVGAVPWFLVGFVYLMTFLDYNIHYPNLYAFVQETTEKKHYGKVTSYLEIQGQVASVLAGAGAAILLEGTKGGVVTIFGIPLDIGVDIAAWEIHDIFLVDAITYFLGFLIISAIRYVPLVERKYEAGAVIDRLKVGAGFLWENKSVLLFGIASYSIFVSVLVMLFYVSPIYVEKHLLGGGEVYASSDMYYGLGAIFAGIAIRQIFREKFVSITSSIILMTFLVAGLYLVLNLTQSIVVFYVMFLLLGICNAGTRIQRVNYLFRSVPNQYYGRANSIFFVTNILFRIFFVSLFALPFFQEGNNVIYTMGIMSFFLLISALVLLFYYKKIRIPPPLTDS